MSFRNGLFALLAVLALGAGMLSMGSASADCGEMPSYVAVDDDGVDPRGPGGLTGVIGEQQACEQGAGSTTCGEGLVHGRRLQGLRRRHRRRRPGRVFTASSRTGTRAATEHKDSGT